MDIVREWKRRPPAWVTHGNGQLDPFTLGDLVRDFKVRRDDPDSPIHFNRDDVVDYCARQTSLKAAIIIACRSLRPDGRLHNHQSRVPKAARRRLAVKLNADRIRIRRASTFGQLFAIVDHHAGRTKGIGPVTTYDVATRIGAKLGLEPQIVHLHAGCKIGARALELPIGQPLQQSDLPVELRRLTPDEVEDFLCTYRNVLGKVT